MRFACNEDEQKKPSSSTLIDLGSRRQRLAADFQSYAFGKRSWPQACSVRLGAFHRSRLTRIKQQMSNYDVNSVETVRGVSRYGWRGGGGGGDDGGGAARVTAVAVDYTSHNVVMAATKLCAFDTDPTDRGYAASGEKKHRQSHRVSVGYALGGYAATRLRGYAATRLRGYAATRLRGYAAKRLCG